MPSLGVSGLDELRLTPGRSGLAKLLLLSPWGSARVLAGLLLAPPAGGDGGPGGGARCSGVTELPADSAGGAAATTMTAAAGGGRTFTTAAAGKNSGTARPTYKKEDIKTYEIPKNRITRIIITITN